MLADEIIDYWDENGPPGKVGKAFAMIFRLQDFVARD